MNIYTHIIIVVICIGISACNPVKDSGVVAISLAANIISTAIQNSKQDSKEKRDKYNSLDYDKDIVDLRAQQKKDTEYVNKSNLYIENKQFTMAEPLLMKSCNLNNSESCNDLGALYGQAIAEYRNINFQQNKIKAAKFYAKACELNNPSGCFRSGAVYDLGIGVVKNKTKGHELMLKACDLGHEVSCRLSGDGFPSMMRRSLGF